MYAQENYRKAKEIVQARRNSAIAAAGERNEEVRRKSEKIRKIDELLQKTGPALFRAACRGEDIEPIK